MRTDRQTGGKPIRNALLENKRFTESHAICQSKIGSLLLSLSLMIASLRPSALRVFFCLFCKIDTDILSYGQHLESRYFAGLAQLGPFFFHRRLAACGQPSIELSPLVIHLWRFLLFLKKKATAAGGICRQCCFLCRHRWTQDFFLSLLLGQRDCVVLSRGSKPKKVHGRIDIDDHCCCQIHDWKRTSCKLKTKTRLGEPNH